MKKMFFSALIALVAIQGNAQRVIVNHVYDHPRHHQEWHHHHHSDNSDVATAAAVTVGVLGIAAIIAAASESSNEAKDADQAKRQAALESFTRNLAQADRYYRDCNYDMALQYYTLCAEKNENYKYTLGNQKMINARIEDCNARICNY